METTLIGVKRNSNMQEMGETREPMAFDCWQDAQKIANTYSAAFKRDFWVLFAAKPHTQNNNALVMGWEVIAKRPPAGMVGVMVFHWSEQDKKLTVETDLSLPYDVPLSDMELSNKSEDFVPTLERAAKKSGSILLA